MNHLAAQIFFFLAVTTSRELQNPFQKLPYPTIFCSRNIEMTPLCKVDVTLPEVRGASGVRDAGGVDEQEGIRSARSSAGCSVWPSACRGRLRTARREAAADLSVAGGFEARGGPAWFRNGAAGRATTVCPRRIVIWRCRWFANDTLILVRRWRRRSWQRCTAVRFPVRRCGTG